MIADPKPPVVVGLGEVLWDLLPAGRQLGGAPANLVHHARALGAEGVVVSRVGDDALGREILARLKAVGIDTAHVSVDREHATGTVTVELAAEGVPRFTIHENVAWDFLPSNPALAELAGRCDALCYGTLAQRSPVTRRTIRDVLALVRRGCLRVFDVNLRQRYFDAETLDALLARSDVLKINDEEVAVVTRVLGMKGDEGACIDGLFERYPLQALALTRGARGSLLARRGEQASHPGVSGVRVADTVGAGDAFTAALILGLLRGHALDTINDAANQIAAYVCTRPGGMPDLPQELRHLL